MELTRILNLANFDPQRRRFRDVTVKHSAKPADPASTPDGRGGISVFETACACAGLNGACVCRHIAKYYAKVAAEPCAYWTFELGSLPDRLNLQPTAERPVAIPTPGHEDECHRNLHNVSDDQMSRLRKKMNPEVRLCVGGQSEPFDEDRAIALKAQYYPDP